MKIWILLPYQLFENPPDADKVIWLEEPLLKETHHEKKWAYWREAREALRVKWTKSIRHQQVCKSLDSKKLAAMLAKNKVLAYHPMDHKLEAHYKQLIPNIQFIESSMFLISYEKLQEYHNDKKTKKHTLSTFYQWARHQLGVLVDAKSTDKENRQPLPKNLDVIGAERKIEWSTTHEGARTALRQFLRERFGLFGTYQDAQTDEGFILYHSALSVYLNVGLLTPREVLDAVMAEKDRVPFSSLEGYVRQLIGWREYMRYLYIFHHDEMMATNAWNATNKMSLELWKGNTDISLFDKEVAKAKEHGYSHHIIRLMVFLNLFVLLRIDPHEVYRWFMHTVCMDAYEWVMKPTIWAFGYYWTCATSKPYISTSAYWTRMGRKFSGKTKKYEKQPRDKTWDALFYTFLVDYERTLPTLPGGAVYLRNLAAWKRMKKKDKETLHELSRRAIEKLTL
jgi:deoxyribodipyrimidine photolyase-related protein